MIIPRPRQQKAIDDLRSAYRRGFKAPILIAPTGFGKSATAICMIHSALKKGNRVWFIAHLKEILNDTSNRLSDAGIEHGWIAAGRDGNHRLPVQVAMVQTLVNLRAQGLTLLVAEQNRQLAAVADRVVQLLAGKVGGSFVPSRSNLS